MNVAAYYRVSTEEQDLERQRVGCRLYAETRRWKLVAEFEEAASGALPSGRRPALHRVLSQVRAPRPAWDALLVYELDRLGRSTLDVIRTIDELRRHGCHLVAVAAALDTTSEYGEFAMKLLGLCAELDYKTRRRRQREGIARARAAGRQLGRPKAPVPPLVLAQVADLRARGQSWRAIAYMLGWPRKTLERHYKAGQKVAPQSGENGD